MTSYDVSMMALNDSIFGRYCSFYWGGGSTKQYYCLIVKV